MVSWQVSLQVRFVFCLTTFSSYRYFHRSFTKGYSQHQRCQFTFSKRLIEQAQNVFKKYQTTIHKKIAKNSKLYGSAFSACVFFPLHSSFASCESQVTAHSRLVGINSLEKLHQDAKFDWKKFFTIVRSEVWYILCAVLVSNWI